MFLKTAAKYFRLSKLLFTQGLMSAIEYRASFITQVVGMIFNDVCWVLVWWIYFQKFPQVNGWEFGDSMLLFGLGCLSFGLFMTFLAGAFELSSTIYRGELDYYLIFPKNVLWHLSVSRMHVGGVGDIIFGLVTFFVFSDLSVERLLFYLGAGIVTTIALYSFIVITQSMSFFVGNFEEAANSFLWSMLTFCIYPLTSFYGGLKVVICTIIPAMFIYGIPHSMIKNLSFMDLGTVLLYTVSIFTVAVAFFYRGLKRYESGSLIQSKI